MQSATMDAVSGGALANTIHPRPVILCFSHLRWNFVYQRPQHLMSLAARDYDVIYFEEPVHEAVDAPRLRRTAVAPRVELAVPVLPLGMDDADAVAAQRTLIDTRVAQLGAQPRLLWFYTPMALRFAAHLEHLVCVYDNMDELSAFRHAPAQLAVLERELLARTDVVFCGGRSLYQVKRAQHRNAHAFPSSIDRRHFARARAGLDDPPDQASLPRPRLGYFGVVDERMDLELLDTLAQQRPDWQWIMVGPTAKIDPQALPRRPNLHWLGMRRYEALPAYLAHWDVGIMPFALNEATRFISPTKTPEFLAAGVPVVSTPIRDVVRPYGERGLVEIATTPDEWLAAIDRVFTRERTPWLARVDRFLAGQSWENTWQQMQALLDGTLHGRLRNARRPARTTSSIATEASHS